VKKRGTLPEGERDTSYRKYLTAREVERLIEATKGSRNEVRDRCLLLLMFRHGLRVSEVCAIKLDHSTRWTRKAACCMSPD
jgi:integrase